MNWIKLGLGLNLIVQSFGLEQFAFLSVLLTGVILIFWSFAEKTKANTEGDK